MKVRFLAFTVACDGPIKLVQLVNFVKEQDPYRYARYDRIIRATEKNGYFLGLVVSVKDERQVCELASEDLVISVREIEEGKNVIDFNFFVVNATTGRGLYQHYHNSMNLTRFHGLLDEQMQRLVKQKVEAATEEAENQGHVSEAHKKRIRKSLLTRVLLTQLVKEDELPDLVDQMMRIKRLRFEVATLTPDAPLFRPLTGLVRTSKTELVFERDAKFGKVRDAVLGLVERVQPRKGKIFCEDEDGHEHILNLLENYDVFGELEYDEVASTMNLHLNDFPKSDMIKRLMFAVNANKAIFEATEA